MKKLLVGAIGVLALQVLLIMGAYMVRITPEVINCDTGRQSATVRVSATFPDPGPDIDGECRGTKRADQITGTIGVDQSYALGGDGLGQRLQPLHLPPPVPGVVVEAISRVDAFARGVLGLHSTSRGADLIRGGSGADLVKGGGGADAMYGGLDNDTAGGGPGNDKFFGEAGNERLSGGEGGDEIHGGAGDDIDLDGDQQIDQIYGEEGNDLEVDGDHGNDLLYGGPGDDGGPPTSENLQHHGLRGEGGENQVYGEDGADTMDAQTAVDLGRRSSAEPETTPSLRPTGWST